jgi:hypothetical protein
MVQFDKPDTKEMRLVNTNLFFDLNFCLILLFHVYSKLLFGHEFLLGKEKRKHMLAKE